MLAMENAPLGHLLRKRTFKKVTFRRGHGASGQPRLMGARICRRRRRRHLLPLRELPLPARGFCSARRELVALRRQCTAE